MKPRTRFTRIIRIKNNLLKVCQKVTCVISADQEHPQMATCSARSSQKTTEDTFRLRHHLLY